MATNTAGNFGHNNIRSDVQSIKKRITFDNWAGTTNDRVVVGYLPPRAVVFYGATLIITAFNDTTADDLEIGIEGTDDDLFGSAVDLNTGSVYTTFDDLADANRYSASARTVTCNFETAPTDDGTTGEAIIYLEYFIAPSV